MTKWLYLTVGSLILSGCCSDGMAVQSRVSNIPMAWDRYGRPTSIPSRKAKRPHKNADITGGISDGLADQEAELAKLKIYSPEWWTVHDAIDRSRDAKLAKSLIICRNCLPSEEDRTGSIGAQ